MPQNSANKGWLLFNPVSVIHYNYIKIFKERLPGWPIKCILNPSFPWFKSQKQFDYPHVFFEKNLVPDGVLANVRAIIMFTAQARVAPCHLIEQATLRSIPVIAIEETHQMLLEQGMMNEYFLPVDHLLVASDYERKCFLELILRREIG